MDGAVMGIALIMSAALITPYAAILLGLSRHIIKEENHK